MVSIDRRLIQPPLQTTSLGTALLILIAILLSIFFMRTPFTPWVTVLAVVLAAVALLLRQMTVFSLAFFAALLSGASLFHIFHAWPFRLLVPVIVYSAIIFSFRPLRKTAQWLRAGRFGKEIAPLFVSTILFSGSGLVLWYRITHPDLSIHLERMPDMPLWVFPLAGIAFSVGNAAVEEFVFRGVVMQATDSAFGPGRMSIVVQAWLFGAMHYIRGFPNGSWGLAMTFIYGIMLGMIRQRSQGLLAPWAAHVCADMVIFSILAFIVLKL